MVHDFDVNDLILDIANLDELALGTNYAALGFNHNKISLAN